VYKRREFMMRKIKYRFMLLGLAMAALLVSVLSTTSYSAHAASSASAVRTSTATSQGPDASDTPCNFMLTLKICKSTDPTVAYYDHATGDTSHCTFVFKITWGDGHSTTKTVTDPTEGSHLVAKHTYVAPGAYTVKVTPRTTAGTCTATSSVHTFTLIPTPMTSVLVPAGKAHVKGHTIQLYHMRGQVVVALPLSRGCVTEIIEDVGTHELVDLGLGALGATAAAFAPYVLIPLTVYDGWHFASGDCVPVPVIKGHTKPIQVVKLHMKY
jgi:hypothetical protein